MLSIFVKSVGIVIEHTKIKRVYINAASSNTWVDYSWRDCSSSLMQACKNNGYAIEVLQLYVLSVEDGKINIFSKQSDNRQLLKLERSHESSTA